MKRLAGIVIGAWLAAGAAALAQGPESEAMAEAVSAKELMGEAYLVIVKADQARDAGEKELALDLYEDALELLEILERDYPGWFTQVVKHRILTCRSEIGVLRGGAEEPERRGLSRLWRRRSAESAVASVPPAAEGAGSETPTVRVLRARVEELERSESDLRARVKELLEANRRLREEVAAHGGAGQPGGLGGQIVPGLVRAEARRLMEEGDAGRAMLVIEEGMHLAPGDGDLELLFGIAACQAGQYARAAQVLEPLARMRGVSADTQMALGVAYMGLERLGDARVAMEEAIAIDPKLAEAHFNLAEILMQLDRPDIARARYYYQTSLGLGGERDPQLEEAIRRGMVWSRAGMIKER